MNNLSNRKSATLRTAEAGGIYDSNLRDNTCSSKKQCVFGGLRCSKDDGWILEKDGGFDEMPGDFSHFASRCSSHRDLQKAAFGKVPPAWFDEHPGLKALVRNQSSTMCSRCEKVLNTTRAMRSALDTSRMPTLSEVILESVDERRIPLAATKMGITILLQLRLAQYRQYDMN